MTNREITDTIINQLNVLQKDDRISRRFILHRARHKAGVLTSQKQAEGSLFRDTSMFHTVRCFPLKKDDVITCGIYEFKRCKSIMKSTKPLKGLANSKYGSIIVRVTTIDGGTEIKQTNITDFAFSSKIRKSLNSSSNSVIKYYEDDEGYIYILNSDIEAVNITLISLAPEELEGLGDCDVCDNCKSIWDYTFTSNDRFNDAIIKDVVSEIAGVTKRITKDENGDNNSNNR